ncbi:cobalt-precorrin 5A hydrolase [Ferrimonas lipolytica]|uniref:Cobalamin biosynthesis protein CbiG n=1 Tax=Ferrimonas lipolytica TaxID=2724191 RepID=A0A6H1UB77_9GAMM|nr:cobalamin biosynthesis protein [Ferrimonas lipolytica]QIZ76311.1 cobalamin biosynthesis protein CbiG [Ferrimonas lipolytica]
MSLAIHAITRNGTQLAEQLMAALPPAHGFAMYPQEGGAASTITGSFKAHFGAIFNDFGAHLCICSVGIMTRVLADLATNKRDDPAVICMDEQGQFVVPVLSGHRGGANAWAMRIAEVVGGQAVITTASDASATLAVDLLGAAYGWQLDPCCEDDITAVSAAVVNNQPVYFEQTSGHRQWWPHQKPWPTHWLSSADGATARVVISHSTDTPAFAGPTVIWRPSVLDLGIGCDRNTPQHVIAAAVTAFCQQHQLSPLSIRRINSIDLKADEVGLIGYAKQIGVPFRCYHKQQLANVAGIENPSATVERCIGVSSVAEAACLFGSGCSTLLAPKFKFKAHGFNVTVAACVEQAVKPAASMLQQAKPMKGYRYHLILCGGRHCDDGNGKSFASKLRRLAAVELAPEQRLKITRSYCVGGCRTGLRAVLYRHDQQTDPNHGVWLQHLEDMPFGQWRALFQALPSKQRWTELLEPQFIAQTACLSEAR